MKKNKTFNRFLGCIFAGAIADAFSAPFEQNFTRDFLQTLNIDLTAYRQFEKNPPGQYTDETMLSTAIIKSIINRNKVDDMDILSEFLNLYNSNELIGIPYSTLKALKRASEGVKWEKIAADIGHADCSTAFRSAPIGLWNYKEKKSKLFESARDVSLITHKDYRATCAAVAVAAAVGFLINTKKDIKIKDFIKYIAEMVELEDANIGKLFLEIEKILLKKNQELAELKLSKLGNDSYSIYDHGGGVPPFSLSVVFIALYHFIKNPKNFGKMITNLIRAGGAINSTCSVAANFWGALNGYDKLPVNLVENLVDKENLYSICVKFFKQKHGIK
jgi:ADP-ribosylglycohydrolase